MRAWSHQSRTRWRIPVSTDLGAWDEQNLAVRLVDGHIEAFRLDTLDDVWVTGLFKAFRFLPVDARRGLWRSSRFLNPHQRGRRARSGGAAAGPRATSDHQGRKVKTEFRYSSAPTKTFSTRRSTAPSSPLPGSMLRRRDGVLAAVGQAAGRTARAWNRGSGDSLQASRRRK